jgi:uncharacterized protein with PIN domain
MAVNEPRFLVDFMLGRLAKWLRALGYDAGYLTEKERPDLLMRSLRENRILITRDHRLSSRRALKLVLVTSGRFEEQIRQVAAEAKLYLSESRLFTRCTICNIAVEKVTDKNQIKDAVPSYVFETVNDFARCPHCGRIYWKGTHQDLLLKELARAGIKLNGKPDPCRYQK